MINFIETLTTLTTAFAPIPLMYFAFLYDRGSVGVFKWGERRRYAFGKGIWRESREGRIIMRQKFTLAALFILITVMRFFGEFPGSEWIRLVVYIACVYSFTSMASNLTKIIQRREDESS